MIEARQSRGISEKMEVKGQEVGGAKEEDTRYSIIRVGGAKSGSANCSQLDLQPTFFFFGTGHVIAPPSE